MGKIIDEVPLPSTTLELTECTDGFWLWDTTRGMNLSMRAKTAQDAFVEALHYYQERSAEVETEHRALKAKVDSFVAQFAEKED